MTSSSTSENIKSHPPDGSVTQRGSVFLEKKLVPMGSPEKTLKDRQRSCPSSGTLVQEPEEAVTQHGEPRVLD